MSAGDPISRRTLLRGAFRPRGLLGILGASVPLPSTPQAPIENGPPTRTVPPVGASGATPPSTLPVHRPPGAVDEASFLKGCTRCGECISVCPVQAIVVAPPRFREAAGTPMIDSSVAACVMCADTPCISACKPGVLRRDQPLTMARAVIQPTSCLACIGSFCTVCSEQCPVPGAIEVRAGRPRIIEEKCTGCGTCAYVCPAPGSAIIIMPLADRPPPLAASSSSNPEQNSG